MRVASLTLAATFGYTGLSGINGKMSIALYNNRIEQIITDADWTSITSVQGVRGDVYALAADAEGSVYIGGEFIVAGDEIVNYITKWNGHRFTRLGDGLDRPVTALVASGTDVILCAHSDYISEGSPGEILKWDGQSWSSLGEGVNGPITAFLFHEGDLYAGGRFTEIDGQAASNIAMWDGTDWSPMGAGLNDRVETLTIYQGKLHAGGYFSMAGESEVNGLASWDGEAWSAIPALGEDSTVRATAVFQGGLVVSGRLAIGSEAADRQIAKWDGENWSRIGNDAVNGATAMAAVGNKLFINYFAELNQPDPNWMAYWDGEAWTPTAKEFAYGVSRLTFNEGNLYAAGESQDPAGLRSHRPAGIYHWDGLGWETLGNGLNGYITATAVSGKNIYIAGDFSQVDTIDAYRVARWDGSRWSALGEGFPRDLVGSVRIDSIAVNGPEVYFGVSTSSAGEKDAIRVDMWDGQKWSTLSEGSSNFDFTIASLLYSETDLYAAGNIGEYNHVAKWDGTSWSELGTGPGGTVSDLGLLDGKLVAGVSGIGVVSWNGSTWSPLGGEFNGAVLSLALFEGDLHAAGNFTEIGDAEVNQIARWDGSRWTALGDAPNFIVTELAASGSALYAAGGFTKIGDLEARRIARWDGSSWSVLGSGVGNLVTSMDVSSDYLVVGGSFYEAGGKAAPYLAIGVLGTPPIDVLDAGLLDSQLTVRFRSLRGLSGWTVRGSSDLQGFPDTLTQSLSITESDHGLYTAIIYLGTTLPENYFLQFLR